MDYRTKKCKPARQRKKVATRRYRFNLPKDTRRLQLEAFAVGSVTALEHYPGDVITSPRELEVLAHMSLAALPKVTTSTMPLTNDADALAAVFVPAFSHAYRVRIQRYQEDIAAFYEDRQMLASYGATTIAKTFIALAG
jgi:hypothetical protein